MKKDFSALNELFEIIQQRKSSNPQTSYVALLNQKGLNSILQKIGEESTEVILAAKDKAKKETIHETADLLFHLLVMLDFEGITPQDIAEELKRRRDENKK